MNLKEVLGTVETILVIDWPNNEVPRALALAGFHVLVRGGPRPEDHSVWEVNSGEIVIRHLGHPPERADLIYSYRPLSELPEIITTAIRLDTKILWTQSGLSATGMKDPKGCWIPEDKLQAARTATEAAGLKLITEPYIADVVRELQTSGPERG